jgi:sugar lactone lactonase YvrE
MPKSTTKLSLNTTRTIAAAGLLSLIAIIVFNTDTVQGHLPWLHGKNGAAQLAAPDRPTPTVPGWPAEVTTIAGDGVAGLLDGPARQARFADPFGLVMDHAGNVFVADGGDNNRIRKITANGMVSTLAGGHEGFADGPAASAAFNTPSALALDPGGNLIVADTGNNAIRKITPEGIVSTIAGSGKAGFQDGPAASAQFNGPLGVAVDGGGNIYVADTYNDRIRRITPAGQVSTLAGSGHPGFQDGPGLTARFDTPCALAVNPQGGLFIADTKNNAIRQINSVGAVTTLARSLPTEHHALLRRPQGLALTNDGFLYVSDTNDGRILQISPKGELRGLTGPDIDIVPGSTAERLDGPVALALDRAGALYVADAASHVVRKVAPPAPAMAAAPMTVAALPPVTPKTGGATFPWPLAPQNRAHEIVGTMGEVRGNYQGESRDHFHRGVDMQAALGVPVLAVANGKVSKPLPAWGYGELNEGLAVDSLAYIHMRVGRTAQDAPLDAGRFQLLNDDAGKLMRVRVKRGTRFYTGDPLGTVNRMYHVHLDFTPGGDAVNPLSLSFNGFADHIAPHIDSIELFDQTARKLGKQRAGRLVVPAHTGPVSIVVDAYDQMDGNAARRRLGLYKLGFQVLRADGAPVPGFEQTHMNLEFNRLPPDDEMIKVAYAGNSGITVFGGSVTHFRYIVTNTVRDGHASSGSWRIAELARGNYTIRIFAADYAGNVAEKGRDLAITIE